MQRFGPRAKSLIRRCNCTKQLEFPCGKYAFQLKYRRLKLTFLSFIGAAWCTQRALRYITVPTQTIAKSCKPLPTMILGVWLGRRYNRLQYLCTIVICVGVALFNLFSSSASGARVAGENQLPGLLLIVLALILDGGTGAFEDKLVKEMNWSHGGEGTLNLMYYINLTAIPLSLFFTLTMEGTAGLEFISTQWHDAVMLSLVGSIGQLFIFHTISTNGALTCCIVTTCRKMFTVVLSVVIFKHMINYVQILGIILTFSGLAIDIHQKFLAANPGRNIKGKAAEVA